MNRALNSFLTATALLVSATAYAEEFSLQDVTRQSLEIDRSACKDFDEFVNGQWYALNPVGPSQETSSSFSEAATRVRTQLKSAISNLTATSAHEVDVHRIVRDFWTSGTNARGAV